MAKSIPTPKPGVGRNEYLAGITQARNNHTSEKQLERLDRGEQFQEEIRRSWRLVPNNWRMRVSDGGRGGRPADEIVITEGPNILGEHKRLKYPKLALDDIRANQRTGLIDFDEAVSRNLGLVFVSFLDEDKGLDMTLAVRFKTACWYMAKKKKAHIKLVEFIGGTVPCVFLPLITSADERTYDLRGLIECYKSL